MAVLVVEYILTVQGRQEIDMKKPDAGRPAASSNEITLSPWAPGQLGRQAFLVDVVVATKTLRTNRECGMIYRT